MGIGNFIKIAGVALSVGLFASAANAATINVWNDTDINTSHTLTLRGAVTCDVACSVLNYSSGAYGFGDPGELFDGPTNSGDASEAAWANSVTGGSFTAADVAAGKTDPAADNTDYVTNALYVILKIGLNPDYTIIRNDSGGALTFSWFNQPGGNGGGLSHYTELGASVVPVPAALPLMLSAFGIGAFVTRKRRKAKAA